MPGPLPLHPPLVILRLLRIPRPTPLPLILSHVPVPVTSRCCANSLLMLEPRLAPVLLPLTARGTNLQTITSTLVPSNLQTF